MSGASPSENPFVLIRSMFNGAYEHGSPISVKPGPDGHEFISGTSTDGYELGLYRLGFTFADGGPETFRVQTAPGIPELLIAEDEEIDDEAIEEGAQEYLVGGGENTPIACEVTGIDPLETRLLEPYETASLVGKIVGATFR